MATNPALIHNPSYPCACDLDVKVNPKGVPVVAIRYCALHAQASALRVAAAEAMADLLRTPTARVKTLQDLHAALEAANGGHR